MDACMGVELIVVLDEKTESFYRIDSDGDSKLLPQDIVAYLRQEAEHLAQIGEGLADIAYHEDLIAYMFPFRPGWRWMIGQR